MKVTARKIQAEGALVYNVVDTSEEGIVLEKVGRMLHDTSLLACSCIAHHC
jgi:hypothetical protein